MGRVAEFPKKESLKREPLKRLSREEVREMILAESNFQTHFDPPADTRPDLFLDHENWSRLFSVLWNLRADDAITDLFWALRCVRTMGASLSIEDGKARIRRGAMTERDYAKVRAEWLLPRMNDLRPFLEEPRWSWQQENYGEERGN